MSIKILVTVYDRAARFYTTPFHVNTEQEAIRSFGNEANRKETAIGANPEDFDLYTCGSFDTDTGVTAGSGPDILVRAQDLVTNKE